MPDVFEVADLLVAHAIGSHGEDVDLVAYHGSHAQGTARKDSDLDIFYVPREGTAPPVGKTFLLDGRLFDFWAIPWTTLEGFATGRTRGWAFAPALVHHATVLHARDSDQTARLTRLKQLTLELRRPEARPKMIRRALETFPRVLADLGNLHLAASGNRFTDVRFAGWQLIQSTIECLALANQTFFHRGLGAALGELESLQHRPADLAEQVTTLGTSSDEARVVDAGEELVAGTRRVLCRLQGEIPRTRSMPEQFREAYPEIKDMVSKLLSACARRDPLAAGAAAWLLQSDVSRMLAATGRGPCIPGFNLHGEFAGRYEEIGLPDLLGAPSTNLDSLAVAADTFDRRLRRWLREESVELCEFDALDDVRDALRRPTSGTTP